MLQAPIKNPAGFPCSEKDRSSLFVSGRFDAADERERKAQPL